MKKPTPLQGWQTSDGIFYAREEDATTHEAQFVLKQLIEKDPLTITSLGSAAIQNQELESWLKAHSSDLLVILQAFVVNVEEDPR